MIAKKQEAVDIGKIFSLHGRSFSQKHPQSERKTSTCHTF